MVPPGRFAGAPFRRAAVEHGAEMVAVTASGTLTADCLPELSWRLRTAGVRLTVDRSLLGPSVPIPEIWSPVCRWSRCPGSSCAREAAGQGRHGCAPFLRWRSAVEPVLLVAALLVVLADGGPALTPREWQGAGGRDRPGVEFPVHPPSAESAVDDRTVGGSGIAAAPIGSIHVTTSTPPRSELCSGGPDWRTRHGCSRS